MQMAVLDSVILTHPTSPINGNLPWVNYSYWNNYDQVKLSDFEMITIANAVTSK